MVNKVEIGNRGLKINPIGFGAKREKQVDSNLKTLDVDLSQEGLNQIKSIFS